ncbi:DUF5677 domain-containing protein [Amnibacterium sp. CER49]|uniref:DUF5677 domain-containing protein n=1 Tax=Amnibacterium sp. CER49 TaxID=3039161 RepID=UPI00244A9799|nr:DUF5677 domain-containing protein [Amnibacterium sp. CER49]MDH2442379.1 DUF5677 domain-containing protein [Amnibacterium sp. CER49]
MSANRTAPVFRTAPELTHQLRRVIDLFPKITGRALEIPADRAEPVNLALVYAFAAHTVEMARGALALYAAGLPFAAVPVMRTAMECAMTAAWLSVAPEQTRSFLYAGAVDRRKALNDMAALRLVDVEEALAEARELVTELKADETDAGRLIRLRMEELAGGAALHVDYRVLSGLSHPSPLMADEWLEQVEQSAAAPLGLGFRERPGLTPAWTTAGLGILLCMVVHAETALDSILPKPRAQSQLRTLARQLGISDTIRLAEDSAGTTADAPPESAGRGQREAKAERPARTPRQQSYDGRAAARGRGRPTH